MCEQQIQPNAVPHESVLPTILFRADVVNIAVEGSGLHTPEHKTLPGSSSMKHFQQQISDLTSPTVVRLLYRLEHSSSDTSASAGGKDYSGFEQQGSVQPLPFFEEPFPDADMQKNFLARIAHMAAFWCCRQKDSPQSHGGTPYAPMILGEGIKFTHR